MLDKRPNKYWKNKDLRLTARLASVLTGTRFGLALERPRAIIGIARGGLVITGLVEVALVI